MAEYNDGGVDMSYGEGTGLGGVNSDEEYETMTAAEVLEKLEEVWSLHKLWDDVQHTGLSPKLIPIITPLILGV